jgi:hypothetical protein
MTYNPFKILGAAAAVIFVIVFLKWALKPVGEGGAHLEPDINPNQLRPGVNYSVFATDLFNAFDGIDFTSTKARAMQRTEPLNDEEFKLVYKKYNSLYKTPPDTLKSDAEAEFIWGEIVNNFIARLNRLNLP